MTKILILGANGFIGRQVVKKFKQNTKNQVLAHSRNRDNSFDLDRCYDTFEFKSMLENVELIVNCTGIGLSKLYCTSQTNEALNYKICQAITDSKTKARIIYLSSIKAYNPLNYNDRYALDKVKAEQVIKLFSLRDRTCILRIPIITGQEDPNLLPFLKLAKKFRLPILKTTTLPCLNIISVDTLSDIISNIIEHAFFGKTLYILNKKTCDWNAIIQSQNKPLCSISINTMNFIWYVLAIKDLFARYRISFPKERFFDLFVRQWAHEKNENIKYIYLDEDPINLISEINENFI